MSEKIELIITTNIEESDKNMIPDVDTIINLVEKKRPDQIIMVNATSSSLTNIILYFPMYHKIFYTFKFGRSRYINILHEFYQNSNVTLEDFTKMIDKYQNPAFNEDPLTNDEIKKILRLPCKNDYLTLYLKNKYSIMNLS